MPSAKPSHLALRFSWRTFLFGIVLLGIHVRCPRPLPRRLRADGSDRVRPSNQHRRSASIDGHDRDRYHRRPQYCAAWAMALASDRARPAGRCAQGLQGQGDRLRCDLQRSRQERRRARRHKSETRATRPHGTVDSRRPWSEQRRGVCEGDERARPDRSGVRVSDAPSEGTCRSRENGRVPRPDSNAGAVNLRNHPAGTRHASRVDRGAGV